jgi:hypothetical protein
MAAFGCLNNIYPNFIFIILIKTQEEQLVQDLVTGWRVRVLSSSPEGVNNFLFSVFS